MPQANHKSENETWVSSVSKVGQAHDGRGWIDCPGSRVLS